MEEALWAIAELTEIDQQAPFANARELDTFMQRPGLMDSKWKHPADARGLAQGLKKLLGYTNGKLKYRSSDRDKDARIITLLSSGERRSSDDRRVYTSKASNTSSLPTTRRRRRRRWCNSRGNRAMQDGAAAGGSGATKEDWKATKSVADRRTRWTRTRHGMELRRRRPTGPSN